MGGPTPTLFSEIYLQFLENNNICDLLNIHHKPGYFCLDDILKTFYISVKTKPVPDSHKTSSTRTTITETSKTYDIKKATQGDNF
jgi:hypothetical protein